MLKENHLEILSELIRERFFERRKSLMGQVLTQIDASIQDLEQRRALRDVIKNIFHDYDADKWTDRNINEFIYQFAEKNCSKLIENSSKQEFIKYGNIRTKEEVDNEDLATLENPNPFSK